MSNIRMQIKDSIMHYLCDDWNNHKRGKEHKENQALFDRKYGYAIWNNTDLEMIMEKVVKGIYAVDLSDHDKQIRDEVIDDFTEKISLEISESIIWGILADWHKHDNMNDIPDKIDNYIIKTSKEIAEQLNAGGENG